MAMAERTANCAWDGDLPHGSGTVTGASGALGELPVTGRRGLSAQTARPAPKS